MDYHLIATFTGLTLQTVSTIFQGRQTFKKSNIEEYFKQLLEEEKQLQLIGNNEEVERRFYYIIDQVAKERNTKKIEAWKNATISLATNKLDYDEVDTHLRTLEYLTVFDLTVLFKIYTTEFEQKNFDKELVLFFDKQGIERGRVIQSLKALSQNYLINEQFESTGTFAGSEPNLRDFYYSKNNMGPIFIEFIKTFK